MGWRDLQVITNENKSERNKQKYYFTFLQEEEKDTIKDYQLRTH